jgi:hypothetical protein
MNFELNYQNKKIPYNFLAKKKNLSICFVQDYTFLQDDNYTLKFHNKCEISNDKTKLLPLINFSNLTFTICYYKNNKLKNTIVRDIPNLENDNGDFSTSIIVRHNKKNIFEIHDDKNFTFMQWNCHILSHNKWEFYHNNESNYKFFISNKIYPKTGNKILEYIATMEKYVENEDDEVNKISYTIISKQTFKDNSDVEISNNIIHYFDNEITCNLNFLDVLTFATSRLPKNDNIKLADKYHSLEHRRTYLKLI